MKLTKYILPFCFLVCISTLFFGIYFRGVNTDLPIEKRQAALFPDAYKSQKKFANGFTNFLNDQLLFRNTLIKAKSLTSIFIFGVSPFPDLVEIGRNNWLYLKTEYSLENYKSEVLYTLEQLKDLANKMEEKRIWLNSLGIEFYVLIPPSKPEIYPENLPEKWKRKRTVGIYDQLEAYLSQNTKVKFIFPKKKIQEQKKIQQLYFKFDTHWNPYGAHVAYYELLKRIKVDFPGIRPPMKIEEIEFTKKSRGDFDLMKMVNIPNTIFKEYDSPSTMKYAEAIKLDKPDYEGVSIFPTYFFENNTAPGPKLLMYRDSYSVDLVPYINCHFKKSTYIWSPILTPSIIEYEKPDVVVLEVVQRRVQDLFIPNDSVIIKGAHLSIH